MTTESEQFLDRVTGIDQSTNGKAGFDPAAAEQKATGRITDAIEASKTLEDNLRDEIARHQATIADLRKRLTAAQKRTKNLAKVGS